jgi:hypothetical protein
MKLSEVLATLLFALPFAAAATVTAEPPDTCTCMMTIVGGGDHRERHCDGFNPTTHARCPCDKVVRRADRVRADQTASPPTRAAAKPRTAFA